MMKTLTLGIALAMCATAIFGAEGTRTPAQAREAMLKKTGGFVVAPAAGRFIKVVDAKSGAARDALEKFTKSVASGPRFAISIADGDPLAQYMPDADCGAVVVVKNDAASPVTITVAPEQGWASVNVHPLKSDNPDDALLQQRVTKELWRALVYMLGGGNNQMPACVMKPCASNKDLDDLKMNQACPEPFREMSLSAKKLGIAQSKLVSYRKACEEGWAPPPSNEYQKAIWDEVHKLPTEPIKIEPETKKVKE